MTGRASERVAIMRKPRRQTLRALPTWRDMFRLGCSCFAVVAFLGLARCSSSELHGATPDAGSPDAGSGATGGGGAAGGGGFAVGGGCPCGKHGEVCGEVAEEGEHWTITESTCTGVPDGYYHWWAAGYLEAPRDDGCLCTWVMYCSAKVPATPCYIDTADWIETLWTHPTISGCTYPPCYPGLPFSMDGPYSWPSPFCDYECVHEGDTVDFWYTATCSGPNGESCTLQYRLYL